MNIYADLGHKVRYTGEDGYDRDHEKIKAEGIKPGDILTVSYTDVGDWSTEVAFIEVVGTYNSVMFEDVE